MDGAPPSRPQGQILSTLFKEAQAQNDLAGSGNATDEEEDNEQEVRNMLDNYQSHLLQQQKHKRIAASQQFREFVPHVQPPMSHSHPCLYAIGGPHARPGEKSVVEQQASFDERDARRRQQNGSFMPRESPPVSTLPKSIVMPVSELTALKAENEVLRQKADFYDQSIARVRQLEQSYEQIKDEFEAMLAQREQQEKFVKATIAQAQLVASANSRRQSVETLPGASDSQVSQVLKECASLASLNKSLQTVADRQKIELDAQHVTLNEQRNHIDMLEKALQNAQERLSANERLLEERYHAIQKAQQLQGLLAETTEEQKRRQDEYAREKAQLEMELTMLRVQAENAAARKNRKSPEPEEAAKLRRLLAARDERIVVLEGNINKIKKSYQTDVQRQELNFKAEIEEWQSKYHKLEVEKLEKDRRVYELISENRRLSEQLTTERHSMDRRFTSLESEVRRLAVAQSRSHRFVPFNAMAGAASTSSIHTEAERWPRDSLLLRQTPSQAAATSGSVSGPDARMEAMRRAIADRRQRPRLQPSPPPPPTSVEEEDPAQIEKRIAEYVATLPPESRRVFVTATGLGARDETSSEPATASASLPEGAKLSLTRQASKGSSNSSSLGGGRQTGVRIRLTDSSAAPSTKANHAGHHQHHQQQQQHASTTDSDDSASRSCSVISDDAPDPVAGIYQYEIEPPQSRTQMVTTTTAVEVNKERERERDRRPLPAFTQPSPKRDSASH